MINGIYFFSVCLQKSTVNHIHMYLFPEKEPGYNVTAEHTATSPSKIAKKDTKIFPNSELMAHSFSLLKLPKSTSSIQSSVPGPGGYAQLFVFALVGRKQSAQLFQDSSQSMKTRPVNVSDESPLWWKATQDHGS